MTHEPIIKRNGDEWVDAGDETTYLPACLTPVFDAIARLYDHAADEGIQLTIETDPMEVYAELEPLTDDQAREVYAAYRDEIRRRINESCDRRAMAEAADRMIERRRADEYAARLDRHYEEMRERKLMGA
jgi:hypothetical protein